MRNEVGVTKVAQLLQWFQVDLRLFVLVALGIGETNLEWHYLSLFLMVKARLDVSLLP